MGLIIPFLNENVMQRKQNMDMSVSEYVIFENLSKEFALFKKKKKAASFVFSSHLLGLHVKAKTRGFAF